MPARSERGGRFDLQAPYGACYLATSALAATLEVFQGFGGLLPETELQRRRRIAVSAPPSTPPAAQLASARASGVGVTAALWAGGPRWLTQRWAAALHRAGWRALHHPIQHDPTGRLRAVTLFDVAGSHAPFDEPRWDHSATSAPLAGDRALQAGLTRYGIDVIPADVQLPLRAPDPGTPWR